MADAEAAVIDSARTGGEFDAAIIDVKGLGQAGVELAWAIRARPDARRTKVILLLGLDRSIGDEGLEDIGALAMLTKPVRPSELFDCLAAVAAGLSSAAIVPFDRRHGTATVRTQFAARILVVEDNPVNQDVAIGIPRKHGTAAS